MHLLPPEVKEYRDFIARRFLRGGGLEIGPGINPLEIDSTKASVRYVDYLPIEEIKKIYGNIHENYVAGDIIDDSAALSKVPDRSQYWIASCHMIEHTEDPIGVLRTQLRKLKPQGVVYCALPNMLMGFDRDRPITSIDHFIRDHEEGPAWSKEDHLFEFAKVAAKVPDEEISAKVEDFKRRDYRIHWHTWTMASLIEFLQMIQSRYAPFDIEHIGRNHNDLIAVLRVKS